MRSLLPLLCAAGALLLAGCDAGDSAAKTAPAPAGETAATTAPATENQVAVISTTEGDMTIAFRSDKAPKTVENFKKLANSGFYNGTAFHRVIRGFMIQGGDPLTKDLSQMPAWGTGGPGYHIKAEFNDLHHGRGVISMARSASPDSAGSQFFICHADAGNLDGQYTAFGKLISGDDVLEKIATTPCDGSRPRKRMEIKSITILPAEAAR